MLLCESIGREIVEKHCQNEYLKTNEKKTNQQLRKRKSGRNA